MTLAYHCPHCNRKYKSCICPSVLRNTLNTTPTVSGLLLIVSVKCGIVQLIPKFLYCSQILCCTVYCLLCVFLCMICVSICTVLYNCHRWQPTAGNKYIISKYLNINNVSKINANTFEHINQQYGNKILYFHKRQRLCSGRGGRKI
jgi:hypothetical protein